MKQFLSFVRKEFYHIFRDTRTILILLVMPVIQIVLFGFAITTEVRNANVAVLDLSHDVASQRIIAQFQASDYFTVHEVHSPAEIDAVFKRGEATLAMIFGSEFHSNLLHTGELSVQLLADATDPNQATTLVNYASNILGSYQLAVTSYQLPVSSYQVSGGYRVAVIRPQVQMLYNPQMKGAYNFVPGVMGLILMLICAMMTSIAIVREKEAGTMGVLLASPIKPIYIILAKMTPYFALSIVNLITILLLSVFVLDVPVAGNLFLLIFVSLIFIITALALGLLISNVVDTQVAAMLVSGMGLMMPTMMLSGLIFPLESMPAILQWLSCILPVRWFIDAVRKLMIQGVDAVFVLKEIAILSGMAVVLLVVSLKKFKIRLQ
ncbi:ABC transporter, ATP-binding/permease protein [Candidatus Symbiothrix dinenymphae]|nr:ABC transporter, ATP-binding/permease protein [Candidatus Symbiothrix dinenymphae]